MTIQDLIDALKVFDPLMPVVVDGYEGGYDDPTLKTRDVVFGKEYPYGGPHSEVSAFSEDDEGFTTRLALVVSRNDF